MHFVMPRHAIRRNSTLCHLRLLFNNGPRNTVFRCITPRVLRDEAKHRPCATEVCVCGSLLAQDACKPASHDAKSRMPCGVPRTRERNNIENALEAGELKTSRQRVKHDAALNTAQKAGLTYVEMPRARLVRDVTGKDSICRGCGTAG